MKTNSCLYITACRSKSDRLLEKVKPKKASVEFGLEVAVESGKLTTLLVKGASTANLKITLERGE
jgi:hypothetical protein